MYISAFLIVFPPTSRLPGHSSTLTRSSVRRAAAEGIHPAAAAAAAQAAPPSLHGLRRSRLLPRNWRRCRHILRRRRRILRRRRRIARVRRRLALVVVGGIPRSHWRAAGWRGGRSCLVASGHGGTEEGVAWVGQLDAGVQGGIRARHNACAAPGRNLLD